MKKFLFIALIVLSGCAKSSMDEQVIMSSVGGKWAFVSYVATAISSNGIATKVNSTITASDFIQFNTDGTGTMSLKGTVTNFSYVASATTVQFTNLTTVSSNAAVYDIKVIDAHNLDIYSGNASGSIEMVFSK